MNTSVMVFTRDLRVRDNPALAAAVRAGHVVPLFVFDDAIVADTHAKNATRMAFLLESLTDLDASLRRRGGRLVTRRGNWAEAVLDVAVRTGAERIHLADDVSGYAARRLAALESLCAQARREVVTHPGVMVTAPGAINPAGPSTGGPCSPYQVFTPYYRRWLAEPRREEAKAPARLVVPREFGGGGVGNGGLPALASLTTARPAAGAQPGGETAGLRRLATWAPSHLEGYDRARDDLAADATSRLSPYLHFGCLAPRAVAAELGGLPGGEPFVRQLAWRDFFCQLLAATPDAAHRDYRGGARRWHDDQDGLAAWQAGQTGFPVVDAAMRQLTSEGFMPGRARMIVASFLTKDLSIDWRAGAGHFMAHLADADVACNQLNWQWVAGTGTDTQRHRIFNPTLQGKRFDQDGAYIRRYVPELAGLGRDSIHDPPGQARRARRYPLPIVDHAAAAAGWRRGHRR
jgi:deoxyribodipyrimidine photo-lyase